MCLPNCLPLVAADWGGVGRGEAWRARVDRRHFMAPFKPAINVSDEVVVCRRLSRPVYLAVLTLLAWQQCAHASALASAMAGR